MFVVGDSVAVLGMSRPLILAPLLGHPDDVKRLDHLDMRGTVKEPAQLDGGFLISEENATVVTIEDETEPPAPQEQ